MHKSEKGCTQRAEASREFLSPSLFSFLSFFFLRQTPKRKKKSFSFSTSYLTGMELSVLSITGLASDTKRAKAPPNTATKATTVATPANSESAKEGAASGSKRSPFSSFLPARATTTPAVAALAPAAEDLGRIELVRRIGGAVDDALRAARGARGLEAARTASVELAERGVAQEEARIRRLIGTAKELEEVGSDESEEQRPSRGEI